MTKPTPKPIRERALIARGFAWKFPNHDVELEPSDEWVLCRWAEPYRDVLERRGKPTPNAVIVPVEIRSVPRKARKRARKP